MGSILAHASGPVSIQPLNLRDLNRSGLMDRQPERTEAGRKWLITQQGTQRIEVTAEQAKRWDKYSGAPQSTEFAVSRFLIPFLAQSGWAVCLDSDVVALADIYDLFALADERYAVMCVKHPELLDATPKMDGMAQTLYRRKNWSSVVLWNCSHEAHRRLRLQDVNRRPGRDLHRFYWLDDSEIGGLPPAWNWLVGVQDCPEPAKLAHYTLGGPWLPGWSARPHDESWLAAADAFGPGRGAGDARGNQEPLPG